MLSIWSVSLCICGKRVCLLHFVIRLLKSKERLVKKEMNVATVIFFLLDEGLSKCTVVNSQQISPQCRSGLPKVYAIRKSVCSRAVEERIFKWQVRVD